MRREWEGSAPTRGSGFLLFLDAFDGDDQADLFTEATGHEADAELGALDGQFGFESSAGVAPGILTAADHLDGGRNRLGLAAHGQVASNRQIATGLDDLGRFEGHGRKLLGVEEVRPLEVLIALLVGCEDAVALDREVERAGFRLGGIVGEAALYLVEDSPEVADTEVLDFEYGHGVAGVDREVGSGRSGGHADESGSNEQCLSDITHIVVSSGRRVVVGASS
ncbi:MAG: hypothetical protein ACI9OJ_002564 [Myxococcota bacterium]